MKKKGITVVYKEGAVFVQVVTKTQVATTKITKVAAIALLKAATAVLAGTY